MGSLRESAQALALAAVPEDVDVCLGEAEELMFARDRISCALAERVGRVHRAGQARQHGHASTRSWLRTAGGMSVAGAGRLLTLGVELARLPGVREAFAAGRLSAGVVEAICTATAQLTDEQAGLVEPILLELAGRAGPAEVAKAGRYLRAVLDPDGEERDEQADYGRRFLRVRPGKGGGLEGEFYLPREAAARLRALLDAYAKPKAEGDDRSLQVRQADALIALLEQKIATELLVLVNAESLPADPEDATPADSTQADDTSDPDTSAPGDTSASDPRDTGSAADPDNGRGDQPPAGHWQPTGAQPEEAQSKGAQPREPQAGEPHPKASPSGKSQSLKPQSRERRPDEWQSPDPPPEDAAARHAHAGHWPAGDWRHGQGTPGDHGDLRCGHCRHEPGHDEPGHHEPGCERPGCEGPGCVEQGREGPGCVEPGCAQHDAADGRSACGGQARCSSGAAGTPGTPGTPGTLPGVLGPEPARPRGTAPGTPGTPPGSLTGGLSAGTAPGTAQGAASQGAAQGAPPETAPGASQGSAAEASQEALPGALLGTAGTLGAVPGLLLATGQVLPVSGVHRLARTSALVRLVMDADGQVLDMGRKVRLATPAQRRAIFARYATCWIDGCPLPAAMCQIDHADNW
ncbi:DUF222 domain-containing protein, partial [Microbispora sp. NPDC046933]|uniref:DUF222 domain-containing protein n=1 Tax=Microbispora sp. NPDC046933 TaxID=3155618 RepID=UPI0033CDB74B